MQLSNRPLVLASQSPQRRQILARLGLDFEVLAPRLMEEDLGEPREVSKNIQRLALAKAKSVASERPDGLIIGADTVIAFAGCYYGKPENRDEARKTLQIFSGQTHSVWTGVGLWDAAYASGHSFACESRVTFKSLSEQELEGYLDSGEWQGRAGAYAIQEGGCALIADLQGSYDNVVGLPLEPLRCVLEDVWHD